MFFPPSAADEQRDEAHQLSADRGERRTADAKTENKHQKRVERDVDDRAAHKAHHGVERAALKAQLVVDDELPHHERRAQQNDAHVRHRVAA